MGPEARTESASVLYAKRQGCLALKLVSSITGLPDRLVLLPGGRVWFVEFKAPGGRVSPRQRTVHALLRRMGFRVDVVVRAGTFATTLDSLMAT